MGKTPFTFIYTGYNPESGEIDVTINGKDYRAHLNPHDIATFEKKLKSGNKIDAMNYLKNRTQGGLKQVNDRPMNESWYRTFWYENNDADVKIGLEVQDTSSGFVVILTKDHKVVERKEWSRSQSRAGNEYADRLIKKYNMKPTYEASDGHFGAANESRMADLDILGQDWDMGMSEKDRQALCSKAGCQDFWHFDWDEIPREGQIKIYQASGGRAAKPLKEVMASADTEAQIRELYQLTETLSKLTKQVKEVQAKIGGVEENLISELERADDNALETKEYVARIKRAGYEQERAKYKEAFDFLLGKVNPALRKIAEEALEATKTIAKVKAAISVTKQGQPMFEELRLWDRVKNILRKIAERISGYNSTIEQALGQVTAKMAEVRHASIRKLSK